MTHMAASDGETATSQGAVSHPPCPICAEGVLVPLNSLTFWACTTPACTYTISGSMSAITYYKGHAVAEKEEKGGKRWVKFSF
ncbi:hypothetical protein [Alienimonas chondri]|uniref:Uncharacterized protein n=1 Tax=Alienimonas chondri TaxID=2681879 RepID=A0ABX1VFI2_9PLAN|nr:hypothetical protein [Alienimonas chondri]NNJ26849.1 hypothetical protein [Alienimonas chondri]